MLARYNDVFENGAERIVAMVENQSAHRIDIENRVIDADISRGKAGLRAGIAVVMMAFGVAAYLLFVEQILAAVFVVAVVVAFIGGAFIYGTVSQRDERRERAQILAGRKPN